MRARLTIAMALLVAALSALALSACGGGDDEPSIASFCESYVAFNEVGNAFDEIEDDDVEAGKAAIDDSVSALDDLAAASPEEVQSDVEETRDWFQGAADAIADSDTVAEVEEAGTAYTEDNPQPTEAYGAIDGFYSDNCDGEEAVEGGSTDSTDSTDATTG